MLMKVFVRKRDDVRGSGKDKVTKGFIICANKQIIFR